MQAATIVSLSCDPANIVLAKVKDRNAEVAVPVMQISQPTQLSSWTV